MYQRHFVDKPFRQVEQQCYLLDVVSRYLSKIASFIGYQLDQFFVDHMKFWLMHLLTCQWRQLQTFCLVIGPGFNLFSSCGVICH